MCTWWEEAENVSLNIQCSYVSRLPFSTKLYQELKPDAEVLLAAAGVGIVNQHSKENRESEMLLSISHIYTVTPQDVPGELCDYKKYN